MRTWLSGSVDEMPTLIRENTFNWGEKRPFRKFKPSLTPRAQAGKMTITDRTGEDWATAVSASAHSCLDFSLTLATSHFLTVRHDLPVFFFLIWWDPLISSTLWLILLLWVIYSIRCIVPFGSMTLAYGCFRPCSYFERPERQVTGATDVWCT